MHGEIAAHMAQVYGADVSEQTISTIADLGWTTWPNGRADRWMRATR